MYCTLFSLGKSLIVWMQKVLILYLVNVHHPIHYNLLGFLKKPYACWMGHGLVISVAGSMSFLVRTGLIPWCILNLIFHILILTLKWQHVVDTSQDIYNVSIFYLIYKMHYCASIFQMIVFCLHPKVLSMLFSAFLCRFLSKLFKGQ